LGRSIAPIPKDSRSWIKLASILLAYRLADVIALVNDVQVPQPRKVQRTRLGKGKDPDVWILNIKFNSKLWLSLVQGLAKLKEWTSILSTFRKSATSNVKPTPAFPGASNTHLKLFKWFSHLTGSKQSTKIKSNLVAAAIHVAFLRNHRFGPEEIPDLTNDVGVLIAAQFSQVLVIL
jgi:hypothetical protein